MGSLIQKLNFVSAFLVAQRVKVSACNARDLGSIPRSGRSLEKEMSTHSSTLAWKIPWAEEPGGLQSMGPQRVGHDWVTSLLLFTFEKQEYWLLLFSH